MSSPWNLVLIVWIYVELVRVVRCLSHNMVTRLIRSTPDEDKPVSYGTFFFNYVQQDIGWQVGWTVERSISMQASVFDSHIGLCALVCETKYFASFGICMLTLSDRFQVTTDEHTQVPFFRHWFKLCTTHMVTKFPVANHQLHTWKHWTAFAVFQTTRPADANPAEWYFGL